METAFSGVNVVLFNTHSSDGNVKASDRLNCMGKVLDSIIARDHRNLFVLAQDKINGPKHKKLCEKLHQDPKSLRCREEAGVYYDANTITDYSVDYVDAATLQEADSALGLEAGSVFTVARLTACVLIPKDDGGKGKTILLVSWHGPWKATVQAKRACFARLVRFLERLRGRRGKCSEGCPSLAGEGKEAPCSLDAQGKEGRVSSGVKSKKRQTSIGAKDKDKTASLGAESKGEPVSLDAKGTVGAQASPRYGCSNCRFCDMVIVGGDFNFTSSYARQELGGMEVGGVVLDGYTPTKDRLADEKLDYVVYWPDKGVRYTAVDTILPDFRREKGQRPFDHPIIWSKLGGEEFLGVATVRDEEGRHAMKMSDNRLKKREREDSGKDSSKQEEKLDRALKKDLHKSDTYTRQQ